MEFKQASDVYIKILASIDSQPVTNVAAAKYIVFSREEAILLEKTLGSGIVFEPGIITVHLTDQDTDLLGPGRFSHELAIRDSDGNDTFLLKGNFKIIKTLVRN